MTSDVTQERIRKVLAGVLAPLARTLLRCGVSYTEFADLAKIAFVDAASADYGVRNRPTNVARVAVMTGLSRKEVSRLRKPARRSKPGSQSEITMPAAVLKAWFTDSRYLERNGLPKILPFGGGSASFSALVRSISRDIPPGAMRQELLRAGAVRRIDRSRLVPTKRDFVPDSADERVLVGLELGLRRLAETIAFNSGKNGKAFPRFQRFVEGPLIAEAELPRIRKELQNTLSKISLQVDDYLATATQGRKLSRGHGIRAGVGIYYFDESDN